MTGRALLLVDRLTARGLRVGIHAVANGSRALRVRQRRHPHDERGGDHDLTYMSSLQDSSRKTGGSAYTAGCTSANFVYHRSRSTMNDDPGLEQRLSRFEAQLDRFSLALHQWQTHDHSPPAPDVDHRIRTLEETLDREAHALRLMHEEPLKQLQAHAARLQEFCARVQTLLADLERGGGVPAPRPQSPPRGRSNASSISTTSCATSTRREWAQRRIRHGILTPTTRRPGIARRYDERAAVSARSSRR